MLQREFCKLVGMSVTAFQGARKRGSTKAIYIANMAKVLGVEESMLFENKQIFNLNTTNILEEPLKLYGKINTDDLLIKVISRLDKIIELMEKK